MRGRTTVTAAMLFSILTIKAGPTIDFAETRHDFGTVAESDKEVSHMFRFTNNGDSPLVIYGTESSCGCTVAEYTSGPVAPGECGTVTVTYTAEGNPGRFIKGIMVKSNIPPGETLLTIEGTVACDDSLSAAGFRHDINGLRLSTTNILMGNIEQGRRSCHTVSAVNGQEKSITVTFPKRDNGVTAEVFPACAGYGEKIKIYICIETSGLWGEESISVPVRVDNGVEIRTDTITCRLNVLEVFDASSGEGRNNAPSIKVETRALNFGSMERGDKVTGEVKISNMGGERLNIRKIETSSPCVSATIAEKWIECGGSRVVSVTVDSGRPDNAGRLLNERIRIITDDPENPVTQIQVTASFR